MLIAGAVFVIFQVMTASSGFPYAVYDAHAYWIAAGSEHPYATTIANGRLQRTLTVATRRLSARMPSSSELSSHMV